MKIGEENTKKETHIGESLYQLFVLVTQQLASVFQLMIHGTYFYHITIFVS
jgi:hypothetical protein